MARSGTRAARTMLGSAPSLNRVLPWAAAGSYVAAVALTWGGDWGEWLVLVPLLATAGAYAVPAGLLDHRLGRSRRTDSWLVIAGGAVGGGTAAVLAHVGDAPRWTPGLWVAIAVLTTCAAVVARAGVEPPPSPAVEPTPGGVVDARDMSLPWAAMGIVKLAGMDTWWDVALVCVTTIWLLGLGSVRSLRISLVLAWSGCWAATLARAAGVEAPVTPVLLEAVLLAEALVVLVLGGYLLFRMQEPGERLDQARLLVREQLLHDVRELASYDLPGRPTPPRGASSRALAQAAGGLPGDYTYLLTMHDGWPRIVGDLHLASLDQLRTPPAGAGEALARVPAAAWAGVGLDPASVAVIAWSESGDEVVVMERRGGVVLGGVHAFGPSGVEPWPSFSAFVGSLRVRLEDGVRHG